MKGHRVKLENYTAALNRLNEVLGALGDETESRLVCIELHDTAESLLDDNMVLAVDIVGIIKEHPRRCARHRTALAHELCETLTNGGNATLIR
jgi:hypothetical protein